MPRVTIDCFPSSVKRYRDSDIIVAIDVIRATSLAVTAVDTGRRCLVARDPQHAFALRRKLGGALLAGELKGDLPDGFDMNNSPSDLAKLDDIDRPLVMLSTSGTELMLEAAQSPHGAYVACFRNYQAVANHLATLDRNVAVIGAGSRNEFREEDQMCCAWITAILIQCGFRAANDSVAEIADRWAGVPATGCRDGNSVRYLERSGQMRDFEFIVSHVNDVDSSVQIIGNEVSSSGKHRRAMAAEVSEAA